MENHDPDAGGDRGDSEEIRQSINGEDNMSQE